MKKSLVLLFSCLLSAPAWGQVSLDLINPATDTGTVATTVGSSFTLDIDVSDATGTASLDSYEITLVPETTGGSATSALTLTNFALGSAVSSTFVESGQSGDTYGAYASSTANDLTISATPENILSATFDAVSTGTYDVVFAPTSTDQNLYNSSGDAIAYTPEDATVIVGAVPEPPTFIFVLIGMAALLGHGLWKRFATARAA